MGPKSPQNQPFCPISIVFFPPSLSPPFQPTNQSHHQLHHRNPTQPPTDHQEPPLISLSSLQPLMFSSSSFASSATSHQPPSLPQPQLPSSRQPLTVSTTSGRLNSSPTAKHTPLVPLSLLQIFFSFFLPALPPATSCNRRSHHRTTSSVARSPPCPVAFFSAHLQLLQPFGCMQNVNSNCSHSTTMKHKSF